MSGTVAKTLSERFNEKWTLDTYGCWLWTDYLTPSGYGQIGVKDAVQRAHRVSYELHISKIPEGLCVLHKCDVRNCVNPDHLFLGTRTDNSADMVSKDRSKKGERHWQAKLTNADVLAIRSETGVLRAIANKYGVSRVTIHNIQNRKTWRHI